MNRLIAGIFSAIIVVLVIGGVGWRSGSSPVPQGQDPVVPPQAERIAIGIPQRRDFRVVSRWFGRVESREMVRVVTLEAGRIVSVQAKDEAPVKKGARLFTLAGLKLGSRMALAREKAGALQELVVLAEQTAARKERSVEEKVASRDVLDAARTTLIQLRLRLEDAKRELQYLRKAKYILAPIDGVFTRRRVSVGQVVDRGTVVGEVIVPKLIRVVARLFISGNAQVLGRVAMIRAATGESLPATVTRVLPERTSEGATIVWIEGGKLNRTLKPGEVVSGEILLSVHRGALALPLSALVYDEEGQAYVFVKGPRTYSRRAVEIGIVSGGWAEITSGLRAGAEVVIEGAYELFYRDFSKVYKVVD